MKIVINALQYKPNSSGIGVMLRELFGLYTCMTEYPCQVILTYDGPEFPTGNGTEIIRCPWKHGQGLRRMFFQTFQLGRKFCRDAVLLTTDSKTPFFLPRSCALVHRFSGVLSAGGLSAVPGAVVEAAIFLYPPPGEIFSGYLRIYKAGDDGNFGHPSGEDLCSPLCLLGADGQSGGPRKVGTPEKELWFDGTICSVCGQCQSPQEPRAYDPGL